MYRKVDKTEVSFSWPLFSPFPSVHFHLCTARKMHCFRNGWTFSSNTTKIVFTATFLCLHRFSSIFLFLNRAFDGYGDGEPLIFALGLWKTCLIELDRMQQFVQCQNDAYLACSHAFTVHTNTQSQGNSSIHLTNNKHFEFFESSCLNGQ